MSEKKSRERTQKMREEMAVAARRKQRNSRILWGLGALVVAVLVAAIIGVGVQAARKSSQDTATPTGAVVPPAGAAKDGSIAVGDPKPDAPVVDLYFDYMCPVCGNFEKVNGADLTKLVESGDINLHMHPLAFLDPNSDGTHYSTRAANAFATVVDKDPEHAFAFHQALYANQPEEGSKGLSDEEIAQVAKDAGVSQEAIDAFDSGAHSAWVAKMTKTAFDPKGGGVTGTPTIKINGEVWDGDWITEGNFLKAVEQAGAPS